MSVNPNVALGFQQPHFNSPLDNFGKGLSLQHLMLQNATAESALADAPRLRELAMQQSLMRQQQEQGAIAEQSHKLNLGIAKAVLSADEASRPAVYKQIRDLTAASGAKLALPPEWDDRLLPGFKALAASEIPPKQTGEAEDYKTLAGLVAPVQKMPVASPEADVTRMNAAQENAAYDNRGTVEVTAKGAAVSPDSMRAQAAMIRQKGASKPAFDYAAKLDAEADKLDDRIWRENYQGERLKQMGAGGAAILPEDAAFVAKQYLSGDRQAAVGFARSAGARIAIQHAIVEEAKAQGMTPKATAAKIAEFNGILSGERTLGNRTATIGMAVNEARNMAPLVIEASNNVDRSLYPTLNSALLAVEKGTGDPSVVKLAVAVNSMVNIYARAINPQGVATVSDKDHARELLSASWSKGQINAGIEQLMLELDAAQKSPGQTREEFRRAVTGEGEPKSKIDAPTPPKQAIPTVKPRSNNLEWSADDEKRLQELEKKHGNK